MNYPYQRFHTSIQQRRKFLLALLNLGMIRPHPISSSGSPLSCLNASTMETHQESAIKIALRKPQRDMELLTVFSGIESE
jgi:hypothetical protein